MTVVKELIRSELDGTLSFGDYTLDTKTKKDGFEFQGDIYKVKTFKEITKLEKNGMFVYESVPGTAVEHFEVSEDVISFKVSGTGDAQITLELEPDDPSGGVAAPHLGGGGLPGREAGGKILRRRDLRPSGGTGAGGCRRR